MHAFWPLIALALANPAAPAEPIDEHVKRLFKSENYTVTWGRVPTWSADAELEVGSANGHGGTFRWRRFRPVEDGVTVLSISLQEAQRPQDSKWPPEDHARVTVTRALMGRSDYAALLRALATVVPRPF